MAANRLLKYIGTKGIGSYIENTRSYTQETLPAANSGAPDTKVIVDGVTKRSDGTNWVVLTSAATPASAGTYSVITVNDTGAVIAGRQLTNNDLPLIDASKITGTLNIPVTGNADTATKLLTSRTISTTGDGTWAVAFDGSNNATAAFTLSNSGATAGTYRSVTVDAKGRVTTGSNPSTLAGYGITDAVPLTSPSVVTVGKMIVASTDPAIEVGRVDGNTSVPYIDFHSGATAVDFDSRISASGGDGVVGHGTITVTASTINLNGAVVMPNSVSGTISQAYKLARSIAVTNTAGTYTNQYTKIISITFAAQYGDYTVDLTMMNAGAGISTNYISKLLLRFKQQAAFGSDPYIDCQQLTQTASDPSRYFYSIVQNTPTTIIDVYAQNNISYNSIYGCINSESSTATAVSYLSAQAYSVSLPGNAVAITKDAGVAAGTYQNVTVGESGRVTAGTNLLPSYTVSTLPSGNTGARYRLSDASGIATYNIDRYYMELSARTWASLNSLSKTGLVAGARCRLTDYNYQEMVYDGTSWRASAGKLNIIQAVGSTTTPLSLLSNTASGNFVLPGGNIIIPAGLIPINSTFCGEILVRKLGSNGTVNFYARLGTADNSASDCTFVTSLIQSAVGACFRYNSMAMFNTVRTAFLTPQYAAPGTASVNSFVTKGAGINADQDMYISYSVGAGNALDSYQIISYRYWIEY